MRSALLPVFSLAIFIGAALLFFIQPMFARMMLPQLGGSPQVWNTAMVFFQSALLAGYAYAHFSTKILGARRQAILHGVLIFAPLGVLPIALPHLNPPTQSSPIPWVFGVMTVAVGAPFFLVSATSPLLQRWLASTNHPAARDPYFLYAASNAGSLLALLSYPIFIEPNFDLRVQSRWWSIGYGVLIALFIGCIALLWRTAPALTPSASRPPLSHAVGEGLGVRAARRFRWVLLAFVPSSWMLSVTTYLTTDIAAIPLLWIIPLALYLLSFIIVFSPRAAGQKFVAPAFAVSVALLALVMCADLSTPIALLIPLHLLAFFMAALACHGALAKDRPAPQSLTEFYLLMSVGGVLGGAFNALLAPLVFHNVTEYSLIIILGALAAIPKFDLLEKDSGEKDFGKKDSRREKIGDAALPLAVGALCAFFVWLFQRNGRASDVWVACGMFGVPCLLALLFLQRPLRFAFAVALIFLCSNLRAEKSTRMLFISRSFFGIARVVEARTKTGIYHRLMHGSTLHGLQSLDAAREREPLTYYARSGPLGNAFAALQKLHGTNFKSIGAIGLGSGTASCYAQKFQYWTFYEIDPAVQNMAQDARYFTYLRACPAPYQIILGDGRLQIAHAHPAEYDLLILDAYSSDALPIHLLTKQALQLYLRKLSPHGVMIFNISNRHLGLAPLMAVLAQDLNLVALGRDDAHLGKVENERGKTASQWIALARRREDFGELLKNRDWKIPQTQENVRAWTDEYSSVLSVFNWK